MLAKGFEKLIEPQVVLPLLAIPIAIAGPRAVQAQEPRRLPPQLIRAAEAKRIQGDVSMENRL